MIICYMNCVCRGDGPYWMLTTCYWAVTVKNGTRANNDAFLLFQVLLWKLNETMLQNAVCFMCLSLCHITVLHLVRPNAKYSLCIPVCDTGRSRSTRRLKTWQRSSRCILNCWSLANVILCPILWSNLFRTAIIAAGPSPSTAEHIS